LDRAYVEDHEDIDAKTSIGIISAKIFHDLPSVSNPPNAADHLAANSNVEHLGAGLARQASLWPFLFLPIYWQANNIQAQAMTGNRT